jgi:hypothetical protein
MFTGEYFWVIRYDFAAGICDVVRLNSKGKAASGVEDAEGTLYPFGLVIQSGIGEVNRDDGDAWFRRVGGAPFDFASDAVAADSLVNCKLVGFGESDLHVYVGVRASDGQWVNIAVVVSDDLAEDVNDGVFEGIRSADGCPLGGRAMLFADLEDELNERLFLIHVIIGLGDDVDDLVAQIDNCHRAHGDLPCVRVFSRQDNFLDPVQRDVLNTLAFTFPASEDDCEWLVRRNATVDQRFTRLNQCEGIP